MDNIVLVFPWGLFFAARDTILVLADEIFDIFWGFGPPYSSIVHAFHHMGKP
jgi:hypothetical protein